jgi:hypothetical protein
MALDTSSQPVPAPSTPRQPFWERAPVVAGILSAVLLLAVVVLAACGLVWLVVSLPWPT